MQYIAILLYIQASIYLNIKRIPKERPLAVSWPRCPCRLFFSWPSFFPVFYQDNWARPVEPRSLTSPLQDLMYVCIQYKRTLMFSHFFSTSLIMFNRMARQGLPAEKNSIFSGLSSSIPNLHMGLGVGDKSKFFDNNNFSIIFLKFSIR